MGINSFDSALPGADRDDSADEYRPPSRCSIRPSLLTDDEANRMPRGRSSFESRSPYQRRRGSSFPANLERIASSQFKGERLSPNSELTLSR